jgi:hypothetical protein
MNDHPPQTIELPPSIRHFSATGITDYLQCPETFRRRYIRRSQRGFFAGRIIGTGNDRGIRFNMQQKIDSHEDAPLLDVLDAARDAITAELDKAGGESEVTWSDHVRSASVATDIAIRAVTSYHTNVAPSMQPTDVNLKGQVIVPGVPVPVIGWMDYLTADGVVDVKAMRRSVERLDIGQRIQGLTYMLMTGQPVDFHITDTSSGRGMLVHRMPRFPLRIEPYPDATKRFADLITTVARDVSLKWQTFGPDEPWPGAGLAHDWRCDYCSFNKDCRWLILRKGGEPSMPWEGDQTALLSASLKQHQTKEV